MPRYLWLVILAALIFGGVLISKYYFEVNPATYQLIQKSDVTLIDTSKPLNAPNGRRPQDGNQEQNDRTFGTVFPYFAAPHE